VFYYRTLFYVGRFSHKRYPCIEQFIKSHTTTFFHFHWKKTARAGKVRSMAYLYRTLYPSVKNTLKVLYTEEKHGGCYMAEEYSTDAMIDQDDMTYVVSLSGGTGSAMAAESALQRYGGSRVKLWFSDVRHEDEDLYRFMTGTARRWWKIYGARLYIHRNTRNPLVVAEHTRGLPRLTPPHAFPNEPRHLRPHRIPEHARSTVSARRRRGVLRGDRAGPGEGLAALLTRAEWARSTSSRDGSRGQRRATSRTNCSR
jgi:hypothetical protein